jgi:GNAT superfamily N-acetyltransferase
VPSRASVDPAALSLELSTCIPVAADPAPAWEVTTFRVIEGGDDGAPVAHGTLEKFHLSYHVRGDNAECLDVLAARGPRHAALHRAIQAHLADFSEGGVFGFVLAAEFRVEPARRNQGVASHVLHRLLTHHDSAGGAPTHFFADARPVPAKGADREALAQEADRVRRILLGAGFAPLGETPFFAFALERAPTPPSADVRLRAK